MNPLTPRQKECLDFIRSYSAAKGVMPSLRDIMAGIGCSSTSHAAFFIQKLEKSGHIRRPPGKARSIEITSTETMQAVLLSNEVFQLLRAYAAGQRIGMDTAASELLRDALGAA